MIEQLTKNERQLAIVILLAITIWGMAFAGAGQGDPLGAHGFLIMAAGIAGIFWVISGYFSPEPPADRSDSYYDDPSRAGILFAMAWAVAGMFVGVWIALLLAYPDFTFDAAWASFGRLRPVHTSGVIFGFGGNALIATSFYVMQRTSRARLPDQLSPMFVLYGYNLFCVLAATGYLMGITQSKEYAEPEWYADLWLAIVWVTYLILYLRTLARHKEPHIYVANWYYLAFVALLDVLQAGRTMKLRFRLIKMTHGQAPVFDGIAVVDLQGGAAIAAVRRCSDGNFAVTERGNRRRGKAAQTLGATLTGHRLNQPAFRITATFLVRTSLSEPLH